MARSFQEKTFEELFVSQRDIFRIKVHSYYKTGSPGSPHSMSQSVLPSHCMFSGPEVQPLNIFLIVRLQWKSNGCNVFLRFENVLSWKAFKNEVAIVDPKHCET